MTKNPLINSFCAWLYILFIVGFMTLASKFFPGPDSQFIAPVVMISLFTLSAAIMAYLFCFEPIQMYIDGKKKQAVKLFLQTVLMFAGFTLLNLIVLFSGIFPR